MRAPQAARAPRQANQSYRPRHAAPAAAPSARERLGSAHLAQREAATATAGAARSSAERGGRAAGTVTGTVQQGLSAGGQHALAAELLLFIAIVAMRAVAQYGPGKQGEKIKQASGGTVTLPALPAGQFGPLFILGNGFAVFFVLSFLAARGGTAAKVAIAGGAIFDLALLLKSVAHLDLLAYEYDAPRKYTPLLLTGNTTLPEAPVVAPALLYEEQTGQLPPTPKGKSAAAAMSYARKLLPHYGWGPSQWLPLLKLWTKESGWNYLATNPGSGAYGIPQSLPPEKMASAGSDWRTNPFTQIKWGLGYIRLIYGTPAAAWAHELHFNWY